MERRKFIGLSASIAAVMAIPLLDGCTSSGSDTTTVLASPSVLLRILNKKTIVETGQAYLKKYPQENNKETLKSLLLAKDFSGSSSDTSALHAYFNRKIENDFESNNTVIINGWVLAATEARQCALFSILQF